MFRVDDPNSEPRVLHELRQKKIAEDAESDIAIRFVDDNNKASICLVKVEASGSGTSFDVAYQYSLSLLRPYLGNSCLL